MAHNTVLSQAVGVGDTIIDVDLSLNTYPTASGKLPATCLYVSANATTAPTPVTAANPLYVKEQDPAATTGTISAADAATSTATNAQSQNIVTGNPTANSSVVVNLSGQTTLCLQAIATANCTLQFECSVDGGTTYTPLQMDIAESYATGSGSHNHGVVSASITDTNAWIFRADVGGLTNVRVRCSTFTSGTIAVTLQPGFGGLRPLFQNMGQGPAGTTPWLVGSQGMTGGGHSVYRNFQTSGAVIAANIKSSAGQVYSIVATNIGASPVYLRLYNETTSPPVTTDTPFFSCVIPGNTAGAGIVIPMGNSGLAMGTGIGVRVTAGIADNDATALTANQVMINVLYN